MGYPGKNVKQFETPNHPYQGERIEDEHGLVDEYGLKNKQELWSAESELRRYRREARRLLGAEDVDEEADQLLGRLRRYGILGSESELDDVLSLDVTDVLERRLQTVVYRSGLANTPAQARQFISHGHVQVDGRRVTVPSYTVEVDEEPLVEFDDNSSLSDELHPERATADQGEEA